MKWENLKAYTLHHNKTIFLKKDEREPRYLEQHTDPITRQSGIIKNLGAIYKSKYLSSIHGNIA